MKYSSTFSLLIVFLFQAFMVEKSAAFSAYGEEPEVRVLLFDRERPTGLRLNTVHDEIVIRTEEKELRLSPADGFVSIYFRTDNMVIRHGNQNIVTTRAEIANPEGVVQIYTAKTGNRLYRGDLQIETGTGLRNPRIINTVSLEEYTSSVVGGEMNFREPEALKAQAVVSRTYALWSIERSPYGDFDLLDSEQNQVYKGILPSRPDYEEAARATRGEVLTWGGELILAAFFSTCGGSTSHNHDVWDGDSLPYLRQAQDQGACSISPHYNWEFEIEETDLRDLIRSRYGYRYSDFETEKDGAGRVTTIRFENGSERNLEFSGNEFRLLVNSRFGSPGLRSTRFEPRTESGTIHFTGNGLGHGVGMCQWGAKGFAKSGWSYRDILSFYFSGVKIVNSDNKEINPLLPSR
ncbi:MAG: SpoIID/LytB domain-containing protein [Balneolaceae bacterium]|nr:SpoIID/LytB domain-containing protein [Balneolaceae bacterium]MCH8548700.1 SpoIID/LytB domain-containing protein [Balneolaceae bacterium]